MGKKGGKNLKRISKKQVQNENGVVFTDSEVKKFRSLVDRANKKRNQLLEIESKMPRYLAGVYQGDTIGESTGKLGKESDFALAPKNKDMQRFTSKKEFNKYMKQVQRVTKKEYLPYRVQIYKKNHMEAVKRQLGGSIRAKYINEMIRKMTTKQYMQFVSQDEYLEISYVYSKDAVKQKAKRIYNALKRITDK